MRFGVNKLMTKITIQNVASFKSPVAIETDEEVNLIYGLNGTGKTTISNFLYYKNNPSDDIGFPGCELDGIGNKKILVYNQNFIHDNFYNKDSLKGIFTLSKKNKEAELAIDEANIKIKKFTVEKEKLEQQDLERTTKDLSDKKDNLITTLWDIKETYTGGDRVLEFCLEGYRNAKIKLFDYIIQITKPDTQPNKTIDDLKQEAGAISDDAQKQELLLKVDIDVDEIENSNIFSEVIIGNKDSSVSALIQKLNNSDWVKQGLDYLPNGSEQCPFCQEKTITEQVAESIRNYFNETYNEQITLIEGLQQQYSNIQLPEITQYENNDFVKEDIDKFNNLYNQLRQAIDSNNDKVGQKIKEPSKKIELSSTKNLIENLNIFIDGINTKITEYNQKIDNKQKTKEKIKNDFWQIMRWNYDNKIAQYKEDKEILEDKIKNIQTNIQECITKISIQNDIILEAQRNTININEAIASINTRLNDLGIDGFSIKKHEDEFYKIVRDEQQNHNFKTLSEGEKMIISFLYFMELCSGKDNVQDTKTQDNKIIVIDDPISSLSHTYIFNVSQLIKKVFFNKYKQVFVLTHSLYFFHELLGRHENEQKDKKLFRLTKSNRETQISLMDKNEIQNDYQAYWQVIKDHDNDKASDGLLANSMRNILEHFFGFIDKNKLNKVINELDNNNNKFHSFKRYIDRESHSDLTNLTDNKEIDTGLFKDAFKDVFDKSGYSEHYNKMIKQ